MWRCGKRLLLAAALAALVAAGRDRRGLADADAGGGGLHPTLERVVYDVPDCVPATDGADVKLRRCIGGPEGGAWPSLDPFLVFDVYSATDPDDFDGGFPAHPHRGFLELRYILSGSLRHKDSCGARGGVGAGGLQLLRAGRGVVHEEAVAPQPAGSPPPGPGVDPSWRFAGFQLWLQSPASRQADPPGYASWPADGLFPRYSRPGRRPRSAPPDYSPPPSAVVKVLSGHYGGAVGPATGNVSEAGLLWLDVEVLRPGGPPLRIDDEDSDRHAFVYVYRGSVVIGSPAVRPDVVRAGEFAVLHRGVFTEIAADPGPASTGAASFMYLSAARVRERAFVTQGFAASSKAGLDEAIEDLNAGQSTHC